MANLIDIITDHYPPASGVSIPLRSQITITFNREMDTTRLQEDFFLEGPDTDQFVGPGLRELTHPDNISQGDLDDFLRSPGYKGIVQGTFEFEVVSGVSTTLKFTPSLPLAPLYEYTAFLGETKDADGNTISGQVYWNFETGTGSIEELPSTISTSVLAASPQAQAIATQEGPLAVVKTTPTDHAIEQSTDLREIVVEFNKTLKAGSVSADNIDVQAIPATDHPSADVSSAGNLAKEVEISGKQIKIKI